MQKYFWAYADSKEPWPVRVALVERPPYKREVTGWISSRIILILNEVLLPSQPIRAIPASILRKSTSGRHRPVSYPDGPMTARYRFT